MRLHRISTYAFLASSSSALNLGDSARARFDSGSSSEEDGDPSSVPLKDISSTARHKTRSQPTDRRLGESNPRRSQSQSRCFGG